MKRNLYYILACAFALGFGVGMISCSKEAIEPVEPEQPGNEEPVYDVDTTILVGYTDNDFTTLFHISERKEYYYEWRSEAINDFEPVQPIERFLKYNVVQVNDNKPVAENVRLFVVDEENPYYTAIDGVLFNKDATILICCPQDYQATEYVVPSSVKAISECAFTGNKNLKKIDLSQVGLTADNKVIITDGAFDNCAQLTNIVYPTNYELSDARIATKHDYEDYNRFVNLFIGSAVANLDGARHHTYFVPGRYSYGTSGLHQDDDVECDADDNIPKDSEIHNYVVDKNNPNYIDIDGVLFSKDGTTLIRFPQDYQATEYVAPASLLEIDSKAFNNNRNLKKVDFSRAGNRGEQHVSISKFLFYGSSNDIEIIYPQR